ncbi:MAG: 3-hydroxyacyl-CoA dehydrogenase family protein [Betaproteobacteria bacterium]
MPEEPKMMRKTVAVIGAGVMGSDLALLCAAFGHEVVLHDIDAAALERFSAGLASSLRNCRLVGAFLPACKASDVAARVKCTAALADVGAADWIIECATEDLTVKETVYAGLRRHCRTDVHYGVNTSCIPITCIASLLPRPELVVGMHFMNPVPLKRVVEVVQGFHTSSQTLDAAREFLGTMQRHAIVVKDMPGFVANRLSHLFMNEAAVLVQEGVASPTEIDAIFREGYGHKMGPLETADLIGLDTVMRSLHVLFEHYQDPKFRCCPLLRKMVDAGVTGKKTGRGFYAYRD